MAVLTFMRPACCAEGKQQGRWPIFRHLHALPPGGTVSGIYACADPNRGVSKDAAGAGAGLGSLAAGPDIGPYAS
jgi:hypothetical protein